MSHYWLFRFALKCLAGGYLNHDPVMRIPLDTDFFYRQLLYLFSGRKFLLNGSGCVTIGSQESAMFELLKVTLKVSSKKDFIQIVCNSFYESSPRKNVCISLMMSECADVHL